MRAFIIPHYGKPKDLQYREVENPTPKDDEVLIKVFATAINDWDWGLVHGDPFLIRLMYGLRKPKYNIPGTEVAGIVEAIGDKVTLFQVGDQVYGDLSTSGFGAFAELVCAREQALIKKPDTMPFEEAVAIPHAGMLAYQALFDLAKLKDGQKVLINGAGGGVGTLAVQMAKELKVEVTGVDSGMKLNLLQAIGYDHVVDYQKEDFTLSKHKYDVILDTKTNRPISHYSRVLQKGGHYISVGGEMKRIFQIMTTGAWYSSTQNQNIKVLGLKPNKDLMLMNEWFEEGKMKPILEGPFPMEEIPRLLQHFGHGNHMGKIVIGIY